MMEIQQIHSSSDLQEGEVRAVPWLRRLVAGLSLRRPGSIHVEFVVEKVALGQVFVPVLRFSPVSIIPPSFSVLIHHLGINSMHHSGRDVSLTPSYN
jgi:hypothetical protein